MKKFLTALFYLLFLTASHAQVVQETNNLSYSQIISALGFTPVNSSNPIMPTCLTGFLVASSSPAVLPVVCRTITYTDLPSQNMDQLTVTGTNVVSALSQTYGGGGAVMLINGAVYSDRTASPPFSISGTTVTWNATNAGFSLSPGDKVVAIYNTNWGATGITFTPMNPINNLSDVSNAATARTNLGLTALATTAPGLSTTVVVPCGTLTFTSGLLSNKGTC